MALGGSLLLAALLPAVAAAQAVAPPASARDLSGLSRDLQALSDRVKPAVVQVLTTGFAAADGQLVKQRATGSGVVLDADGYVITNAHVVQGARRIQVALAGLASGPSQARSILKAPGRLVGAVVVGTDAETDLAVLKIDEKGLPFMPLGDSEALRPGQLVLAFGSPLGLENSVTLGIVSAVARQIRPEDRMIYVQTDASINPGNSGGPLVDGEGRVVGINTFILSQSGGSEGIGFAAPSNIVRYVYEQIRTRGRVHRGEIGVRVQTVTPGLAAGLGLRQEWGVVAADVPPGGAAARAGLRIGDLILKLDGKVMENARQLEVDLYPRAPGGSVNLDVLRGTERLTFVVPIEERPRDPARFADRVSPERNAVGGLGVLALDLDDSVALLLPPLRAKAGVVVATSDGRAGPDPLQPGDVIYSVNQDPVTGVESLRQALGRVRPHAPVVLKVEREGELRFLVFEPE
ncbi:MAG: peptidase S1 [Acidobacteria bacterium]|nr:MAG: peptidase S1 [Acidobacteriota bacterium]